MKYIQLGIRYNLLHLFYLVLSTCLREINLILIYEIFNINSSLIYCIIMFLAEMTFGMFFLFFSNCLNKKKYEQEKYKGKIELIEGKRIFHQRRAHPIILFFILFMGSYFDFESYIIPTYALPRIKKHISISLDVRIRPLFIIFSSLISRFSFENQYGKHQKLSLLIISINFIIMVSYEFGIQYYVGKQYIEELIYSLVIVVFEYVLLSIHNNEAKYLMDIQYVNQYKVLFIEGSFGLIPSIITFCLSRNYEVFENINGSIGLLIFLLFTFYILCGIKNIYACMTIKLYSSTTYAMCELIVVPFLMIYYYIRYKEKGNFTAHFVINMSLSIINFFFSCVYNELLILNFCNLSYDTYLCVSQRASLNLHEMEKAQKNEFNNSLDESFDFTEMNNIN